MILEKNMEDPAHCSYEECQECRCQYQAVPLAGAGKERIDIANSIPDTAPIWAKVIHTLPSEQLRFALNAARHSSSQCQPSLVEKERQQPKLPV